MNHLDEGALQALLDEELEEAGRRRALEHLRSCEECSGRLAELEGAATAVTRGLEALAWPVSVAEARTAVEARIQKADPTTGTAAPGPEPRVRSVRSAVWPGGARPVLARAAVMVLLATGAVAVAVPGSPLRAWIGSGWQRLFGEAPVGEAPGTEASVETRAEPAGEGGVRVGPAASGFRIVLSGVAPGTEIRIRLVHGDRAGVYAGEDARYRTGPGSVEAILDGGDARVEVPRSASDASVIVDGRLYFRKVGDRIQLPGPARDSSSTEIRFRVPAADASPSALSPPRIPPRSSVYS